MCALTTYPFEKLESDCTMYVSSSDEFLFPDPWRIPYTEVQTCIENKNKCFW